MVLFLIRDQTSHETLGIIECASRTCFSYVDYTIKSTTTTRITRADALLILHAMLKEGRIVEAGPGQS